jgi:SAM-dependent methyltransferase
MSSTGPHGRPSRDEIGSPRVPCTPRTAEDWIRRHSAGGSFESVGYIGLGENYNRWLYRLRRRHFVRLAARCSLATVERVLDVGTGNGFYVGLYQEIGLKNVCGIDISPAAIERLGALYPRYQFETCDVAAGLPASIRPESGFEWVSAMDVLFHLTEDVLFRAALANCARAVRPGGGLLVSDNFPPHTLPADDSQSYHALCDYEDVLRPLGFRLVELRPIFFLSNGQVGGDGAAFRIVSSYWRLVSRGLGKSVRSYRPLGEALGYTLGAMLTSVDALLQHQSLLRGFSTKTAIFRRAAG